MTSEYKTNHHASEQGFSMLELLIALALLGILLSLGFSQLKPPAARILAGTVKSTIQQARFEAVKRNRAVAVVFYEDHIELRSNRTSQHESCDSAATDLLRKVTWPSFGTTKLHKKRSDALPTSLYWLPSGHARKCSGGAYFDTLAVTVRGMTYHVITNQGGRTRLAAVR